ncbi:MAG: protein kinase [Gallionellaceae bacterium]|nr:protein kinase [Gallionellaceae bacterium]
MKRKFREYEYSEQTPLGKGGSATVYEATRDGGKFALKIFDKAALEEFGGGETTRISRQLELRDHKIENLIKIFDGGYDDEEETYFLVMEYLPWPSLEKSIGQLPDEAIPSLIGQLAKAAKDLEELGVVHRDIKPANIHVSEDFKLLKLLDLGVMQPIEPSQDVSEGRFVGTLRYAPPEFLLRKEKRDLDGHRAITFYQIGGVLHDMLMKKPLFEEHSKPKAALYKAVEFVTPDIVVDKQMDYWAALADSCLAKDPRHRVKNVSWNDFFGQAKVVVDDRVKAIGRRLAYVSEQQAKRESGGNIQEKKIDAQYFFNATDHVCEAITRIVRDESLFPYAQIPPPNKDISAFEVSIRCELKRKAEDVNPMGVLVFNIRREFIDSSEISLRIELGDIVQTEQGQLSERWLMNKAEQLVCDILDRWIESYSHEISSAG